MLDQDVYSMPPGAATKLQNFEPSVLGGYRRLSGTAKYSSSQVNGTNTLQGVVIYNERVYAVSGGVLAYGTGGSWTSIATGLTTSARSYFERFNYENAEKIIMSNGSDGPRVINNTTVTTISESSVAGAKFVASFREHMFYAGMSSTPQELVFSVPFNEDDFTSGSGAGSIKVDCFLPR